jgi:DNA-binding XRE family transcriptional regulator
MLKGIQYKLLTRCEDPKDLTLSRLRALRLHYTISKTAALLGVSRWSVCAWLAGKQNPSRLASRFIALLVRLPPREHERLLCEVRPHFVDRTKRKGATGPDGKTPSHTASVESVGPHDFEI